METKYDVVVIGAGLGGLSAAAHLAKAGKRVLVLEHHAVPGGYAHEFRRSKFRFEVALHALDGVAPGGWTYTILKELGVLDRLKFRRLDPFYSARFGDDEIVVPADMFTYEADLIRRFPHEASGIRSLVDAMLQVFFQVRRFTWDREMGRQPPPSEMMSRYARMLDAMSVSWGEFMGRHIRDPRLQAVFSVLWGYYGLPPSRLNAATFILPWVSYHLFGGYYPEGSSMALSRALEAVILENGGEFLYRQTVNRVEIEGGRAVAVETEKGLRIEASAVVSNASAPDTMLKFVGREHLPGDYVHRVEEALSHPALSNLIIYLGLDRDLSAEGWQSHELFVSDDYDIEKQYEAVVDGRFEDAGFVMAYYNLVDPGCSPPGTSVLVILTLAPWDYADQWGTGGNLERYHRNPQYREVKQEAAEKLLVRAEKLVPGLRESIRFMEIATPLTNYRYTLNPAGSIYGSEQSVDNMYVNRLSDTTPIPNLFLTGAWVMGGGMSAAMLSGRNVARRVLRHFGEGSAKVSPPSAKEEVREPVREVPGIPESPPEITLEAVGSGRKVNLGELRTPAVLIFHGPSNASEASRINAEIRTTYPRASEVLVANVVDLDGVPKLFRSFAGREMKKAYEKAAAALPAGASPEEYVVVLPDWDGKATKAFGLAEVEERPAVVVLKDGRVVGAAQGDGLAERAAALLKS